MVQKRVQSLLVELSIPDDKLERRHGREASVLQLTLVGLLDKVVGSVRREATRKPMGARRRRTYIKGHVYESNTLPPDTTND